MKGSNSTRLIESTNQSIISPRQCWVLHPRPMCLLKEKMKSNNKSGNQGTGMIFDYSELTSPMRFMSEEEIRQNAELLMSLSRHATAAASIHSDPPAE